MVTMVKAAFFFSHFLYAGGLYWLPARLWTEYGEVIFILLVSFTRVRTCLHAGAHNSFIWDLKISSRRGIEPRTEILYM